MYRSIRLKKPTKNLNFGTIDQSAASIQLRSQSKQSKVEDEFLAGNFSCLDLTVIHYGVACVRKFWYQFKNYILTSWVINGDIPINFEAGWVEKSNHSLNVQNIVFEASCITSHLLTRYFILIKARISFKNFLGVQRKNLK